MEARDQITAQFREAVRKAEAEPFPGMDKIWERVEERLDSDKKEETRKVIPFGKISLAAALLLILGLAVVYLLQNNAAEETLVQQPVEKAGPVTKKKSVAIQDVEDHQPISSERLVTKTDKDKHKHRARKPLMGQGSIAPPVSRPLNVFNVKGKIVDENGEPIPGVLVKIKGTKDGTASDMDGNYEIEIKGQQTLELVGLGMERKELVSGPHKGDSILTTALRPTYTALNEVAIVQPYGRAIIKQKYVGAATVITSKRIQKMPQSDLTKALEGAAPGIQITNGGGQSRSQARIKIRGAGTRGAGNVPLVLVDGVPYSGKLNAIDPKDIKEVKVLNDAKTTAVYGARGANGVIVVTTKSGKGYKAGKLNFFRKIRNVFRKRPDFSSMIVTPQSETISGESYEPFIENPFESPGANPLSTFSIDVDNAAYTNIRRFINNGQAVPKDAVRIEEMVNFFHYQYPQPKNDDPFSINTDYSDAPWNAKHKLLRIGLQGKSMPTDKLPVSNLVFLIDVSGSMNEPNKLPLLKSSMKLLVSQLRKQDKVAIVVYAGAAGLILPPTTGDNKKQITDALEQLQAGGSTAGGQGIELAYKIAQENFIENGNNRVILATDGDFNVGASSDADMKTLIEQKRKSNIFLTCLGYGMGNYKDSKMEVLADKGNGNYAYIDNLQEANRFLVKEFAGTMYSIAKDVKIQIEFNPQYVQSYRLIGYENRKLKNEDFVNDAIDAGELGSGHTVTALYEIIPTGIQSEYVPVQPALKYAAARPVSASLGQELATVKFRYKKPDGDKSTELVHIVGHNPVTLNNASPDFKLASAVAWFGLKLRDSKLVPDKSKTGILKLAAAAIVDDADGYKAEFVRLVEAAQ